MLKYQSTVNKLHTVVFLVTPLFMCNQVCGSVFLDNIAFILDVGYGGSVNSYIKLQVILLFSFFLC